MTDTVQIPADVESKMLRHTLATLAYRGGKALRNAPEDFAALAIAKGGRTPVEILAHVGDLFDWALSMAEDKQAWAPAAVRSWSEECDRFFTTITGLDTYLAENAINQTKSEQLFQGPIADAFTHIGQIALLRRVAGSPVRGENYVKAMITTGRTGPDQPPSVYEFD